MVFERVKRQLEVGLGMRGGGWSMAVHCGVGLGALGVVAGPLWGGVSWEVWYSVTSVGLQRKSDWDGPLSSLCPGP